MKSWFAGTASSVNSEIITPFSNAEQIIYKYNQAIEHNSLTQQGWQRLIAQCDDGLASYLTNIKGSTASMSAYSVSLQGNITGYTKITQAMKQYNALGAVSQKEQQNFATAVSLTNTKLGSYLTGLNGAKASLSGYGVSLVASTAKTVGLTIATTALNAALTFGISAIITGVVSAFTTWINSSKKITEAAEEAKNKISSINDDLKTNTETVENAKQRYAELAQEVENLGKVNQSRGSLSTDEYEEFLDLSNQLAEVFPQLSKNYDDNGNAILNLSGDVDTIVGSLDDLLQKEKDLANQKIMDEFPDVYKGYVKDLDKAESEVKSAKSEFDKINNAYQQLQNSGGAAQAFDLQGNGTFENADGEQVKVTLAEYEQALKDLGIEYEKTNIMVKNQFGGDTLSGYLINATGDIDTAFTNKLETAKKNLDYAKQQLEGETSSISSYLNTWLQTEFTYNQIDDAGLQTAVQDMIMNFDFSNLPENVDKDNWNEVSEYLRRNILFAINDVQDDPEISKAISEVFTNQDLTPDEKADYLKQIKDYFDNELGKDNAISIVLQPQIDDVEALQKSYENTINRFKDSDKIKDFFDTEGINTDEEINDFNEVTKGINDADKAIQTWNEHKKEANETPISFTDALNSSEYTDIKEKLLDLAKSGQLTPETLSSTQEYLNLLKETGTTAEQACEKIKKLATDGMDFTDWQTQLENARSTISDLQTILTNMNDNKGKLTDDDVDKIISSYPSLIAYIGNEEAMREKINELIGDQGDIAQQAASQMLEYNESAYKELLSSTDDLLKGINISVNGETNNLTKFLSKAYNTDLNNFSSLAEAKLKIESDLIGNLSEGWASFYGVQIDALTGMASITQNQDQFYANTPQAQEAQSNLAAYNEAITRLNAARDKMASASLGTLGTVTTKSKKSKSKTKSDAAEVFDFIEIKLNNLTDKASKAKDKIDDLLSFNSKKNQTKKAIEATTKAIKAQEKAYKKYIAYANKAAKEQNSKKTTSSSSSSSTGGNALYDEATNYLGLKYVWGGASLTSGADCSGFTQQIYKKFGVSLPHHAADQAKMGTKITSKKNLQAGDLVFFGSKNNITHVGIYGGDGKFIESPHTGASVRVSKLSSRKDFVSGSRFSKINSATSTSSSSGKNVKKVKGVSSKTLEHYKKLIREGTLGSDGIASIKNENLKNALKDYQTYYEKAKACEEQVASLTDQLKDLYETLANNPIDSASDKIEKLGTKMDLLNSKVENAVVNADKKSSITSVNKLYKSIISNYDSQLNASEKAYTTAKSNFSSSKKTLTKKFNKYSAKKLGLTSAELKTIKNNLKNNKKIPGSLINKIYDKFGYCSLYEKCIAHNEYLDAYKTATDDYRQAREDNKSNKRQTASDQFQNISGGFDNKLSSIEHTANMAQANLDFAEATGHYATQKYYKDLLKSNQETMNTEQDKMNQLIKKRDEFVKNGQIKKGDDAWQQMSEDIWQCAENIQSCKLNAVEFNNSLRDLEWEAFDRQEEYIDRIIDEANFLIDIMDSKEKFDENGNITSYGKSAEGLHAINANTYQQLANDKADEIARLDAEYANDKYNKDYLERREELLEAHREAIKGYHSERSAIVNLVSDGYNAMSEALDNLIDKRKEALSSEKNLYDYQKSITEKTKSLAKLRKQLDAIQGDNSEETKAQIQKIKVSIEDAQSDLQDAEYNQWMSDQEELMDKVSDDFKDWIDNRLKNTDDIVKDVIKQTNLSASEIKSTLEIVTNENGTKLTTEMSNIFDTANGISETVSDIWNGSDGVKTKLGDVIEGIKSVVEAINKKAVDESVFNTSGSSGSDNKNSSTSNNGSTSNNKTSTTTNNKTSTTTTNKTSSSTSSSSSSKTKTNAKWAAKYLKKKKFKGDKSKLNKNGSIVDRLKYFDFDSSESARAKFYKGLYKASYSGTAAQNNKLIAEMKKHGFKKGGEIGNLVKLTGEDGFVLARKGEGILTPENMETLRESINMSNATLSMINNLTKTPQIKPSNLNNTVNPTVNIGDIQVVANNPQEFAREFRNTVINDPKTQKMLSTFIGNQLTGGNSLEFKKYK